MLPLAKLSIEIQYAVGEVCATLLLLFLYQHWILVHSQYGLLPEWHTSGAQYFWALVTIIMWRMYSSFLPT